MKNLDILEQTAALAREFLESLPTRKVGASADVESLRKALGGPLPDEGVDPAKVIEELVRKSDPGVVASAGPRYFGFVVGGSYPVAVAADWMTSAWDQNVGLYVLSPAAAVIEEVAAAWILDVLGLPHSAGVGFVTGGHMANFVGLAAGRHEVLRRVGWNVEEQGLIGAPPVNVVVGEECHISIKAVLGYLGLGRKNVKTVPADEQGRMRADDLAGILRTCQGPTIVCAQAGDVDTGAFDPMDEIITMTHAHGGWVHVDGAFGLWAAANPELKHLVKGMEKADSWGTDGHKWLNVPYDSGISIVANAAAHNYSMTVTAAYLEQTDGSVRDAFNWVPEGSRRGRAAPIYATLRALGRKGLAALLEESCRHAKRFAHQLGAHPGIEVLNDVVLNQVLVRFLHPDGGDSDELTRTVVSRVQADGTCWLSGTTWKGRAAMRISISGWSTTDDDVDQSVAAIIKAKESLRQH